MERVIVFVGRYLKGWQVAISGLSGAVLFLVMNGAFIALNAADGYNDERFIDGVMQTKIQQIETKEENENV